MSDIILHGICFPAGYPQTVDDYLALGYEYDLAVQSASYPITINYIAQTMRVSVEAAKAYYRDVLECDGEWPEEVDYE